MQELTFWNMVFGASFFIQFLMLVLLAASILSWVAIFQRWQVFRLARQEHETFKERFWSGIELSELFRDTDPYEVQGAERVVYSGFKTFNRIRQKTAEPEPILEGVERSMRIALAEEQDRLHSGLSLLATIGSVSPHIGLFGTVWGIMEAFKSLAGVQQATFAVVAPGMAEALMTTALGLFVAIPSVIAYNRYVASSESLLNHYENFADEFSGILHRSLIVRKAD
ncbi:protein TolQ [Marinospirillum sp. MEB164]|uniref:Tol-Pal system protein TolQ n=1 Tax=Marinospirillum alkalitolerans TaxID=3123374 RepID=A0ABW8PYU1_9GAMM